MKKIVLTILLFSSLYAIAQEKFTPDLKQGAKLHYIVFSGGQDVPVLITLDSLNTEYVKLGWNIDGIGNGGWVIRKKSLESATRGWWDQPVSGTDQEMSDDQSVLLFSKAQWNSIQKDKKADFDMQSYTVKQPSETQQLKLAGKPVDVILLETPNGTTRVWLLNNQAFPLIIKIEGNPVGPDLELREIQ